MTPAPPSPIRAATSGNVVRFHHLVRIDKP